MFLVRDFVFRNVFLKHVLSKRNLVKFLSLMCFNVFGQGRVAWTDEKAN